MLAGIREDFPRMRLVGSDIFTDGLVFAKARLPGVELYQMDARSIPFEGEFDVVGAFDVLEHLVEDNKALAQMFNATRPGGGLLVTVPQQRYLWSASDRTRNASTSLQPRRIAREKSRPPGSRSSESLLSILCCFRLWFGRVCNKNAISDFQPWRELEISSALNKTLESILKLERLLIEKGVSFPVGGSLLLIGRRPLSPS